MSDEKGKKKASVNWIFTIIGVALIIAGVICLVKSESFKKNAVETEATITEIDTYEDSDGDTQYNVLVEFRADGVKVEGSLGYHVSGMFHAVHFKQFVERGNRAEHARKEVCGCRLFSGNDEVHYGY